MVYVNLKNADSRDQAMPHLFEKTSIKNLVLKNRFVRSATWECMANKNGSCTSGLIDLMVQLAEGGVGLIITGHAYVLPAGQAGPSQLGIYTDTLIRGLRRMTQKVHQAEGNIILQLAHSGSQADSELTGSDPKGPSRMHNQKGLVVQEMRKRDIDKLVEAFGDGAVRAKEAGFDGVQIHAAHGYLLSQFLSPFFNKRRDPYGGSIENRSRIVLGVLERIKESVGGDFPVMIKMNSEDFLEDGFSIKDMLFVASALEMSGIDAIELSGGTSYSGKYFPIRKGRIDSETDEVYYLEAAKRYKDRISVPLILVGGIRSYRIAEELVSKGIADYISLCRPLIREPDLINRWKNGNTMRAKCLSDNECLKTIMGGKKELFCVIEKERLWGNDHTPL